MVIYTWQRYRKKVASKEANTITFLKNSLAISSLLKFYIQSSKFTFKN